MTWQEAQREKRRQRSQTEEAEEREPGGGCKVNEDNGRAVQKREPCGSLAGYIGRRLFVRIQQVPWCLECYWLRHSTRFHVDYEMAIDSTRRQRANTEDVARDRLIVDSLTDTQ